MQPVNHSHQDCSAALAYLWQLPQDLQLHLMSSSQQRQQLLSQLPWDLHLISLSQQREQLLSQLPSSPACDSELQMLNQGHSLLQQRLWGSLAAPQTAGCGPLSSGMRLLLRCPDLLTHLLTHPQRKLLASSMTQSQVTLLQVAVQAVQGLPQQEMALLAPDPALQRH